MLEYGSHGGGTMRIGRSLKTNTHLCGIIFLAGLFFFLAAQSAHAYRSLDWRDGKLWVVSDPSSGQEDMLFPPFASSQANYWMRPIAVMSPDDEWVAFSMQTGGGFEGEGQSLYVSRWNGEDERLLLDTTRVIENAWWLETESGFYVAMQLTSGGTAYRSFFQIVGLDSGQVAATVEGRIYRTSNWGARYSPMHFESAVGLRYEVLSFDEEPYRWGTFYVDELIRYDPLPGISSIEGVTASESKLIDGDVRTAWIADSVNQPEFTVNFSPDFEGRIMQIQSGYQWHEPPPEGAMQWDGIDRWALYDRPKKILLTFSDGREMEIILVDTRAIQTFYFPEDISFDRIEFKVMSVYRGIETGRVAIGEMAIY